MTAPIDPGSDLQRSEAPFGHWPSDLDAAAIAQGGRRLGQVAVWNGWLFFAESRPAEKGRTTILATPGAGRGVNPTNADPSGEDPAPLEILPKPFSARSRVHEYGGGAFTVADGRLFFVNDADGRVYMMPLPATVRERPTSQPTDGQSTTVSSPPATPWPVTPEAQVSHADLVHDPRRNRLLAIQETRPAPEEGPNGQKTHPTPVARLVSIPVDLTDDPTGLASDPRLDVLAETSDFLASPALSPDGNFLAYLTWAAPDMPWDATALVVCQLGGDGRPDPAQTRTLNPPKPPISNPRSVRMVGCSSSRIARAFGICTPNRRETSSPRRRDPRPSPP